MIVLGIDTSCDDTSVAVVDGQRVLSNIISSQDEIHAAWGGVVPNLAKRAHQERFVGVYKTALQRAHISEEALEAIAVTVGPGLAIALGVGIDEAQKLGARLSLPVVAVNHIEGHLFSALAKSKNNLGGLDWSELKLPALGIIVSGGHTELLLIKNIGEYEKVGQTVDDALGEAFDKVARMLGLGYPGGALLAKLAEKGDARKYALPIAMRHSPDLNVSYSGLKTATRRLIHEITKGNPETLTKEQIQDIAATFQNAAFITLLIKIEKALELYPVQDILLGGGVAANSELRRRLRQLSHKHGARFFFPKTKKLCADNAAMIAQVGEHYAVQKRFVTDLKDLDRKPNWSITET